MGVRRPSAGKMYGKVQPLALMEDPVKFRYARLGAAAVVLAAALVPLAVRPSGSQKPPEPVPAPVVAPSPAPAETAVTAPVAKPAVPEATPEPISTVRASEMPSVRVGGSAGKRGTSKVAPRPGPTASPTARRAGQAPAKKSIRDFGF